MFRGAAAGALVLIALGVTGCAPAQEELAEPELKPAPVTSPEEPATETVEPETVTETVEGETEASISESPAAREPDCSTQALQQTPGLEEYAFHGECIGGFGRPGMPQTDAIILVQWDGQHWQQIETDGVWDGMGMARGCHNPGKLEALGVPQEFIDREAICGVYGPGETPPHVTQAQ